VTTIRVESAVSDGVAALASADWGGARDAFEAALTVSDDPEALDGLGRALWWLRDGKAAIVYRERAYAAFRREGDLARAARIALWLSREYAIAYGNAAAANGWLARADRLLEQTAPGSSGGWLDLARSERTDAPPEAARLADAALATAVRTGDADLELRSIAQLGLTEVAAGDVDAGLDRLDEAMAAVVGGEAPSLETFADVCCTLMLACELAGDDERSRQWTEVLESFARTYDHTPLLAFCRTCCAGVHVASGRVDEAEAELQAAMEELREAGQQSRCIHPAARLAEIRVLQGRFEDAEALLVGVEDDPEALDAAVALHLARGEGSSAASLVEQRLAVVGRDTLLAAPLLARLVEARLAERDVDAARRAAAGIEEIAESAGRDRIVAMALLARGRVAVAAGGGEAEGLLREAVNRFSALGLRVDTARARLELARALAAAGGSEALDVARRAHAELDTLGASREAGEAAALVRSLGGKARSGPRAQGSLTGREREVLRLLGEGLTNAEIGMRLFISPKTVEHHVARTYRKLDVSTRAEAASWAARNLGAE
jgi:DNA-binding CsgD family transcriptional regulator